MNTGINGDFFVLKLQNSGYSIKDAHIYVNQIEGIEEQIKRYKRYRELLTQYKDNLADFQAYKTGLDLFFMWRRRFQI